MKLVAMTKDEVVEVLKKSGSASISATILDKHIAAGAPTNADGTINFLYYVAWLIRETNAK
jgi:hypothetical protein